MIRNIFARKISSVELHFKAENSCEIDNQFAELCYCTYKHIWSHENTLSMSAYHPRMVASLVALQLMVANVVIKTVIYVSA